MKKKIIILAVIVLVAAGAFFALKPKPIKYTNDNLGYDLGSIKGNVSFNVYHTDSVTGKWELLKSFPVTPREGFYYNIRAEEAKNKVVIKLEENTYYEEDDTGVYDGSTLSSCELKVEGYDGYPLSCHYREALNKNGEQIIRLYPVSNGDPSFLQDIGLDKPYKNGDLDDILVTISIDRK